MRIAILDEDTIRKIAAGEVVERPASAVKELVENSIDAGSGRIEIEIQKGGKSFIRVADDGCGMTEDELALSLERHSTSKIKNAEDLFLVKSLGFRGEALPSICSISRMELISRSLLSGDAGFKIKLEGGKIVEAGKIGCPVGTTAIVKDLFFNTPARLKFLKGEKTEFANILDLVSKFILSHPRIAFKLKHNGQEVLVSPGQSELIEVVSTVYGAEIAQNLRPINYLDTQLRISGFISNPQVTRSARGFQSFFVNGRQVKNILLSRALEEGYLNLIPNHRFPAGIVFIELDPQAVDVNVHPAKREVKFSNTFQILEALKEVVRDALAYKSPLALKPQTQAISSQGFSGSQDDFNFGIQSGQQRENLASVPAFQIENTFIAVQEKEGLVLIDQHAAHERILFEKLKNRQDNYSQKLLIPETVEISPTEAQLLEENLEYLTSLGFEIESFGKNTVLIRAIPSLLSQAELKKMLRDILDLGRAPQPEAIFKTLACHGAIKAGDTLSDLEISRLFAEIKNSSSLTCPHGRPAVIRIVSQELKQMFGRT